MCCYLKSDNCCTKTQLLFVTYYCNIRKSNENNNGRFLSKLKVVNYCLHLWPKVCINIGSKLFCFQDTVFQSLYKTSFSFESQRLFSRFLSNLAALLEVIDGLLKSSMILINWINAASEFHLLHHRQTYNFKHFFRLCNPKKIFLVSSLFS